MQLTEVSNTLSAPPDVRASTFSASLPVRLMMNAVSSGLSRISASGMSARASLRAHRVSSSGWPPMGCHSTV